MNIEPHESNTSNQNKFNPKAELVVHVDELLDKQHQHTIEGVVANQTGIDKACFNMARPHLMIIGYDPRQTNSGTILEKLRQQRLNAQRIG